jgi:hypothetical protein
LRFSLRLSFTIGIIGAAVLGLSSHLVLSIFGPGYARTAFLPLLFLIIGYIPMVPRTHYVAVSRAQGRVPQAAVVLTIGAAMEVIGAITGAKLDGLVGLSAALLLVRIIEGAMTAPTVIRAALAHGPANATPDAETGAGSPPGTATDQERQQTGIAMLASLDASTGSQAPLAVVEDIAPLKASQDTDENMTISRPKVSGSQAAREP